MNSPQPQDAAAEEKKITKMTHILYVLIIAGVAGYILSELGDWIGTAISLTCFMLCVPIGFWVTLKKRAKAKEGQA
jgi:hypothetical protein